MKLPPGLTGQRVLALAGVSALMAVLVASVAMIAGFGGEEEQEVVRARPAATAEPATTATPTPSPEPTPVPLTAAQRAARRAAVGLVESRGFKVVRLRDYDPRTTLRVLIGRQTAAPEGRLAFFFVGDRYIGNDTSESSARVRVRRRRDRQLTLSYGIFAPGDEPCCPSGGPVHVRFRWNGAALEPLDPLPPAEQRSSAYQPG